ncbi:MAG: bi-domain-containing oxidoreductase, partial [Opitutaceae bacterium]
MKQVLQNLGSGETSLADVPAPLARRGLLLIRTEASLVSLGTEKMLVSFGQANLLEKARQQPEKVKQVIQKIGTDGLRPTIEAVRAKLDQPLALGYCNAGRVVGIGDGVTGFSLLNRVVSNGAHAEVVSVSKHLCARIPDNVSSEAAAFTVVAAIGLQGVRLAAPSVGETVAVIGLGLIGLLTVQILRANGCRVLGTDFDSKKCALARRFGAETVDLSMGGDPLAAAEAFSRGRGVDAVLITASTKSSEPVSQAARMCRKRGRIVLVGVTGLELNRSEFYEKELTFQVSCSYGPGRYDPAYEQGGHDYPVGFVRWTEQRNFEAVLDLMASGAVDPTPLISHRFPIERAVEAYDLVGQGEGLGIVLSYAPGERREAIGERRIRLPSDRPTVRPFDRSTGAAPVIGVIGAGNYTGQTLLPALAKTGARLHTIISGGGVTAVHLGRKFRFEHAGTSAAEVFADPEINTVLITTRHDSHARYVLEALRAGKRVFVEKPLCLSLEELEEIGGAVGGEARDVIARTTQRSSLQEGNIQMEGPALSGPFREGRTTQRSSLQDGNIQMEGPAPSGPFREARTTQRSSLQEGNIQMEGPA